MHTSKKWKKWLIAASILAPLLVYAYPYRLYYVRDDSGGVMLWNADEAYIFIQVARRGYHMSYAEYPWAVLFGSLGAIPLPNDQRVFLIVIHVTPSGAERHLALTQDDTPGIPSSFTPLGRDVYTYCNGVLCKWAGDHFENATPQEQKQIGGIEHLVSDSVPTVNGWSKRGVYGDFSFTLGNKTVVKLTKSQRRGTPTIELDQSGKPPQELWNVNGEPRHVSWWTYKRSFSGNDLK